MFGFACRASNALPGSVVVLLFTMLVFVSGGVFHAPSSLRYFVVPAVVDGAGTRPAFAPVPDFTKLEYVVSVNFAFFGTLDSTVWLLTVSEFPPFARSEVGLPDKSL